jgi:hypothetical protein
MVYDYKTWRYLRFVLNVRKMASLNIKNVVVLFRATVRDRRSVNSSNAAREHDTGFALGDDSAKLGMDYGPHREYESVECDFDFRLQGSSLNYEMPKS